MSSNKPFPSSDLDVFKDNSLILDNFVNSQENEHPDRFGRKRPTITGIIKEAFNVRTDISNMNETLIGKSRWDTVPKNTSLSLGGDNGALNKQAQALFNRTEMLKVHSREALRRTYLEMGLTLVPGSFESGGTVTSASDVLLHEASGKAYGWSGAFPKVVVSGSSVDGFIDRSSEYWSGVTNAANYLSIAATDSDAVKMAISAAGQGPVLIPNKGSPWNLVNVQVSDFQTVFGHGTEIILNSNSGALFHGNGSKIKGFSFFGSGKDSGLTNQNAVSILSSQAVGAEKSRTITSECTFKNLGGAAWLVQNVVNDHEGNQLTEYTIDNCHVGVDIGSRGEYTNWGGGSITNCNTGARLAGGNSVAAGTVISDNNVAIELVNSVNDSHGVISGALINHNLTTIKVGVLQSKSFLFANCMMYYGKIEMTGTEGLRVEGCDIFAMPIYEDGAVNCVFKNNKWMDNPITYPNHNGNASEVFYIDNSFPTTTSNLQQWGIDGGYVRGRCTSSITNILPGSDRDVIFNKIESNSICGNLNYTRQLFIDTSTGYIDTRTKFIKRQFANQLNAVVNIGVTDSTELPKKEDVDVVLFDTAEGLVKGVFTAGPVYISSGYKLRNYIFNGQIPKGVYSIRILNRSTVTLTSFSDQPSSPNVRSYVTVNM